MIEQWIHKLALQAEASGDIDPKDLPIFRYGLQMMVEIGIIFMTMLLVSLAFDKIIETMVWLFTIIIFRSIGEGYHAKTFKSCYFISVSIYLLTIASLELIPSIWYGKVTLACLVLVSTLFVVTTFLTFKHQSEEMVDNRLFHKIRILLSFCFYFFVIYRLAQNTVSASVLAGILGFVVTQLSHFIKIKELRK
ncbi:accessory gene regulator B family protein [Paenibacillus odorifer]|uniref:accessory gene regulator B family protein n=1 Tax=Paenibacillus odorifer TaxID=189426 RepID=UPI0020BF831B|nr:accessory gene regulator B family protein [Paenibacillus odorifer]